VKNTCRQTLTRTLNKIFADTAGCFFDLRLSVLQRDPLSSLNSSQDAPYAGFVKI
jgi:hypothetical protein